MGINELLSHRFVLATLFAVLIAASAPAGAAAISPNAPSPVQHKPRPMISNPHLKGVEHVATRIKPSVKKAADAVTHHPWHRRWDYRTWIALHRGLGIIRGFVHGPAGGTAESAKVVLRHPNGSLFINFARKHVTYTDAEGNFTMVGVRPGRYRVFAQHGKAKGHAQTAVHPGFVSSVSVKI